MATANFPSNPVLNQSFTNLDRSWTWNGQYWQATSTTVGYTGSRGPSGMGFTIAKTYLSVAALTADTSPTGIVAGQFALIDTGNVENTENSRLYLWNGSVYNYVTDLSGAQGITGQTGSTGYTGSIGYVGSLGYTGSAGTNANLSTASINELSDVDTATTTPTNGQALLWNGTNWTPGTVSTTSSLATLTDVDYTTPPTDGQALIWNNTSSKWAPGAGGGGGGGTVTGISIAVSDTAPATPTTGSLWFNSIAGQLLIYYDSFWIQPSAPEGSGTTTTGSDISTSYLNDLYDVVALTPVNGESLIWDTTSSAWIPGGTAKSLAQIPGTVFSYSTARYRTAKLVCQAVNASVVEVCELLITHNGTTAYSTKYANVTSSGNDPVIVYDATFASDIVSVTASNAAGFTISVTATLLE